MTQTVTVPGIGNLKFPDGMSQDDMRLAIQKNFPQIHPQTPKQPTGIFPQAVSGLAEGVADVAGSPVDLANNLANLGITATGYVGGKAGLIKPENLPQPETNVPGGSDWIKQKLRGVGLTAQPPQTGAEGLVRGAGELAGSALVPGPGGKTEASAQSSKSLAAIAKKYKVPITYGELTNSRHAKNAEMALEQFPVVGLQKFREGQQEAVKNAATKLVDGFKRNFEDPGKEVQTSLQRVLGRTKEIAGKLYDRVSQEITRSPENNKIPMFTTKQATEELLANHPDIFDRLPDKGLKQKLDAITRALPNKNIPGELLDASGQPLANASAVKPTHLTFDEARYLRKKIGNYINRAAKSAGAVGSDEFRQLNQMKAALDKDINAWGDLVPNQKVVSSYRRANKFYQDHVAPFRDVTVDKVTGNKFDTDTMLKTIIKPDRPRLAQKIISQLDPKGRQAVKYGVLQDALDHAIDPGTGIFSPQKFSSKLSNMGATSGVVFNQAERKEIGDFTKLMAAVPRAGQFMESPPTGYRLLQTGGLMGTGYMAAKHPYAFLASGLASKGLGALFTTKAGKSLLNAQAATKYKLSEAMKSHPFLPIALQHLADQ